MDKPNIVFLVNNLDSGGIENYLLRFLIKYYSKFKNIHIYCKSGKGGQLEARFLQLPNVKIIKKKLRIFNINDNITLYKFLKCHDINIVCDFTGNFSGKVLFIAQKAKVRKRVAFYRGSTNHFKEDIFRNSYNKVMNYLVRGFATDILSNSKSGLDFFFPKKWEKDKRYKVVYNGIDAEPFLATKDNLREELSIPRSAYVIGHTGRYTPAKNHDTILEVAKELIASHDDVYFILCGNGVRKNLFSKVDKLKLLDRILLFENREDIPLFLNTMDCYFFPSITEGQPNALIEAMVMGLPYVASNINPIKETVFNSNSLFSPYDSEGFIKALTDNYKKRVSRNLELQKKATTKFNADINFDDFYKRLII